MDEVEAESDGTPISERSEVSSLKEQLKKGAVVALESFLRNQE